jgi:hypothetical protein
LQSLFVRRQGIQVTSQDVNLYTKMIFLNRKASSQILFLGIIGLAIGLITFPPGVESSILDVVVLVSQPLVIIGLLLKILLLFVKH